MTPLPDRDTPWLDPRWFVTKAGHDLRRPRYQWTPDGMALDAKGPWLLNHMVPPLDPDPRVPDDSTPPRLLPPDDGNPGTVIALVVLAAIVVLAVVGWWVAVPR